MTDIALDRSNMDALTAIYTRTSPLLLREPAPSARELEQILEAGMRAPDHGRIAPWRFVVIEGERRATLGDLFAAASKRRNPECSDFELDGERRRAFRAPVIIVVAARIAREHKVREIEQVVAVGAAVQNMILAAHGMGFGAMWKTGAAAYDPDIKVGLGLEPDDHIVAFLHLGAADKSAPARTVRKDGLVTRL